MRMWSAWTSFRALVREKRHRLILWGGVVCFLLLSLLAVVGDRGFLEIYEFSRHLERVETQIRALDQENRRLRAEMMALQNDLHQVEKLAREELGLARPDELIFEIQDSRESGK